MAVRGETAVRGPLEEENWRGQIALQTDRNGEKERDNRFTAVVTWSRFAYCVKCACRIPPLAVLAHVRLISRAFESRNLIFSE